MMIVYEARMFEVSVPFEEDDKVRARMTSLK